MARQPGRILRARKGRSRSDDDSLLVRSAESLGRVIGSLQRQVHRRSKRLSPAAVAAFEKFPMPRFDGAFGPTATKTRKPGGGRKPAGRKSASTRKGRGAAPKTAAARTGTASRKRTARAPSKKR